MVGRKRRKRSVSAAFSSQRSLEYVANNVQPTAAGMLCPRAAASIRTMSIRAASPVNSCIKAGLRQSAPQTHRSEAVTGVCGPEAASRQRVLSTRLCHSTNSRE